MSEVVDPSLEDRSSPRGRPLAATLGICTVHSATCIYRYADEYTPRRGRSCGSMVEKKGASQEIFVKTLDVPRTVMIGDCTQWNI